MKSEGLLPSGLACLGAIVGLIAASVPVAGFACDSQAHESVAADAVNDDLAARLSVDEMDAIERHTQPRLDTILRKPVPKNLGAEPTPGVEAAPATGDPATQAPHGAGAVTP